MLTSGHRPLAIQPRQYRNINRLLNHLRLWGGCIRILLVPSKKTMSKRRSAGGRPTFLDDAEWFLVESCSQTSWKVSKRAFSIALDVGRRLLSVNVNLASTWDTLSNATRLHSLSLLIHIGPQPTSDTGPRTLFPAFFEMNIKRIVLLFPLAELLSTHVAGDIIDVFWTGIVEKAGFSESFWVCDVVFWMGPFQNSWFLTWFSFWFVERVDSVVEDVHSWHGGRVNDVFRVMSRRREYHVTISRMIRTYSRKRKQEQEEEQESPKRQRTESPRKLARDLSHIFDEATSASVPSTPTKLAKRMLGRSKTDSSIETSPSRSALDKTQSMPSIQSPSSSPSRPPPAPLTRTVSNKRTYAGKSRTFLVSLPVGSASLMQDEEDDFLNRESYSSLRSRWGVDNSSEDQIFDFSPPKSNSQVNSPGTPSRKGKGKGLKSKPGVELPPPQPADIVKPLRSITELRDKGESRRFLDEVGYLLEGMGPDETPALQRARWAHGMLPTCYC